MWHPGLLGFQGVAGYRRFAGLEGAKGLEGFWASCDCRISRVCSI